MTIHAKTASCLDIESQSKNCGKNINMIIKVINNNNSNISSDYNGVITLLTLLLLIAMIALIITVNLEIIFILSREIQPTIEKSLYQSHRNQIL